jgi:hemerythrin
MNVSLVVWDDRLSVGFEILDNQHKVLIDIINDLVRACGKGAIIKDIVFVKTLRKAIDYAQIHFAAEEKYLRQAGYPGLAAQKKEHEAFVAGVMRQLQSFEENRNDPVVLVEFLKSWLLNHIAVMDRKYAPYLAGL